MPKHVDELKAIRTLRDRHPNVGAYKLAKKIVGGNFAETQDYELCNAATNYGIRSYYSVLSVIRRYDTTKTTAVAKAA